MDIRPSTVNAGLTPTLEPSGAGAAAGAAAEAALRAASGLDLAALASQWASSVAQARSGGGDGVTNANGKPAIAPPAREFSAAEMVDLLRALQGKTQDAQLRSAKENIENNRIEQAKNNEEQARKVDEWIQKSKEAEKGGILGKIFGWIGAIVAAIAAALMVVAAVAATAVTGGAAGPVMVTLAAIAVAGAVSLLANQISAECGGPEISISNLVTQVVSKLLQAFGVEPELAEKIGNIVAGAAMLMTGAILIEPGALGKMAGAIAVVAGADPQTAGYIAMAVGLAATITVGVVMAVASFGAGRCPLAPTRPPMSVRKRRAPWPTASRPRARWRRAPRRWQRGRGRSSRAPRPSSRRRRRRLPTRCWPTRKRWRRCWSSCRLRWRRTARRSRA